MGVELGGSGGLRGRIGRPRPAGRAATAAPNKYFVIIRRGGGEKVAVYTQETQTLAEAVRLSEEEHRRLFGPDGEAVFAEKAGSTW